MAAKVDLSGMKKTLVELLIRFLLFPISGFRPIRIGSIKWKGKISIMISYIEPKLRKYEGMTGRKPLLFVLNFGEDPNQALANLYRKKLILLDDSQPRARRLIAVLKKLAESVHSNMSVKLESGHQTDAHRAAWELCPVLSFSEHQKNMGLKYLEQHGIERNAGYVGFVIRDQQYYDALALRLSKRIDEKKLLRSTRTDEKSLESSRKASIINPSLPLYLDAIQVSMPQDWSLIR